MTQYHNTHNSPDRGSQTGRTRQPWWSSQWFAGVTTAAESKELGPGRRLAREATIDIADITPGGAIGRVTTSPEEVSDVQFSMPPLSETQQQQVTAAITERAHEAALLLAGIMPQTMEDIFYQAGAHLLPETTDQYQWKC